MGHQKFDDWTKDIEKHAKALEPLRAKFKEYTQQLEEYLFESNDRDKTFVNGDPNEGYKFHLNVTPENVRTVSAYLKLLGVEHKFLSGGEIESGKIFTVYTGSKGNTEKVVKQIADNLSVAQLLEPMPDNPADMVKHAPNGEVPYAPNIYGRFVGRKDKYRTKVSRLGIAILQNTEQLSLDESVKITNQTLLQDYGEYYGGGISYYQPGVNVSTMQV